MDTESFLAASAELDDLHASGDYEAAYQLALQLLEHHRTAELLVRAARLEQLLDDPPAGVSLDSIRAHLDEAHQLEPRSVGPLLELGHFHHVVEDDPDAGLRYFERARESSESALREAWIGKVSCLIELGQRDLAADELSALRQALGPAIDLDDLDRALAAIDPLSGA